LPARSGAGPPRILLIGLMGAGKTRVGTELARRVGCDYLDNDVLLQEATGMSLRAFFDAHGSVALHDREWHVFEWMLEKPAPWVASAAASVVADQRAEPRLIELGIFVVWLRARVDTLVKRVHGGANRPLLEGDVEATIARMARERSGAYAAISNLTLDVDDAVVADTATSILRVLEEQPGTPLVR
jgi:shikimate kinase